MFYIKVDYGTVRANVGKNSDCDLIDKQKEMTLEIVVEIKAKR